MAFPGSQHIAGQHHSSTSCLPAPQKQFTTPHIPRGQLLRCQFSTGPRHKHCTSPLKTGTSKDSPPQLCWSLPIPHTVNSSTSDCKFHEPQHSSSSILLNPSRLHSEDLQCDPQHVQSADHSISHQCSVQNLSHKQCSSTFKQPLVYHYHQGCHPFSKGHAPRKQSRNSSNKINYGSLLHEIITKLLFFKDPSSTINHLRQKLKMFRQCCSCFLQHSVCMSVSRLRHTSYLFFLMIVLQIVGLAQGTSTAEEPSQLSQYALPTFSSSPQFTCPESCSTLPALVDDAFSPYTRCSCVSSTRAKTFELHFNPIANEIELYCPGKGSFSIATDLAPLNLSLGNGSDHGVILGKSCYYSMETLRNQMVFNSDIFSLGLGLTSLKVLNLKPRATRKNQISLSRSSFESISSLGVKVVNVEVSIGQLGNSCFESLKDSLEEISIKNTAIKQIPNDTFSGLSGLKTLKIISNSDINETFAPDLFKGLISLETLLLRQNNQSYLHESSFRELISLKYLDIGGNRFRTIPINIFELNANLEELKILNDCNTHNLSPCSRSLTSDLLKPLTKLQSFSYSLFNRDPCANFTQDFFRHSTYSLSQVRISHACLPNDDLSVFQSLQRVKTIDASENNIVSVENFVPNSNLKSLNLYQNLLKCTCDNVQALRTWNRTVDLGKKLRIACKPNNLSLERARAKLQCQFLMEMPVFWVGCAVAILTLALAVFLYALRSRRATWRRDSFYDESGEFDAFLSYCDEDKELAHHIKDTLEAREGSASTSEMQIFIHEQHFDAGPPILENIARAVDQSRCTVLIISKAFISSHWCQKELETALNRNKRILGILRVGTRIKDLQDCPMILNYVSNRTCLLEDDPEFWKKLRSKLTKRGKNKNAKNFLSCCQSYIPGAGARQKRERHPTGMELLRATSRDSAGQPASPI